MNATSVRNETALVAGGSRGLGLLVARELAERGYRVHVCARDADELARGAALLAREGLHITTAVCDVTSAIHRTRSYSSMSSGLWIFSKKVLQSRIATHRFVPPFPPSQ